MLEHLPTWLGHALGSVRAGADRVAIASLRPGECARDQPWQRGLRRWRANPRALHRRWRRRVAAAPLGPASGRDRGAGLAGRGCRFAVAQSDRPCGGVGSRPRGQSARGGRDRHERRRRARGRGARNRPQQLPAAALAAARPAAGARRAPLCVSIVRVASVPDLEAAPGRSALLDELGGRLLGVGVLTGTYSRDDPAAIGPVGAAASA